MLNKRENDLLAMDRLIYQTDTCRIFHYSNAEHDRAIRNIMTEFPNQSIWRLAFDEAYVEDTNEHYGYLIYHLRSNEK